MNESTTNGPASTLSDAELRRYSRHILIPEVGVEGQEKLRAAKVLLIGAGGLGSPNAMYLAAAGVGTLGLVEFDTVDETNLQRQILYGQGDIGRPKLEAAIARLAEINPLIELRSHATKLNSSNALEIIGQYDIVVDGSDNFPTRYLVNDACVLTGRPNVYGSIFRFEGQVSVFWGAEGPCYRCLFPEPPPPGLVPSCAEGGVLGVLPGIIGSLQTNEAIKLILGQGDPLIGRLLVFDALSPGFRELRLQKDPACPVCSESPTLTELIDYEAFCGGGGDAGAREDEQVSEEIGFNVSPQQVHGWVGADRNFVLLDVRTPVEWQICHLEGAIQIPIQELDRRWQELDPESEVVAYCHTGVRSAAAVRFLQQQGFSRAHNLAGGIDAWSRTVDPELPTY